jgi:hypothetical protein
MTRMYNLQSNSKANWIIVQCYDSCLPLPSQDSRHSLKWQPYDLHRQKQLSQICRSTCEPQVDHTASSNQHKA